MLTSFNVRVYGILINDKKQVLVSDERIYNNNLEVTKFPGGGLELGEGTIDCIIRECKEELDIDVEVIEHVYTTDFFQQSAFNDAHQIISIYYAIKPLGHINAKVDNSVATYPENVGEIFRFVDWEYFSDEVMTLPIDKIAAKALKEKFA